MVSIFTIVGTLQIHTTNTHQSQTKINQNNSKSGIYIKVNGKVSINPLNDLNPFAFEL
jgi:hypothetical protein